jgi:hypothetical protein
MPPVRKKLGRQGGDDIVCLRPCATEMLFSQILRFRHLTNQLIGSAPKVFKFMRGEINKLLLCKSQDLFSF